MLRNLMLLAAILWQSAFALAGPVAPVADEARRDDQRVADGFITADAVAVIRADVDADPQAFLDWLNASMKKSGATDKQIADWMQDSRELITEVKNQKLLLGKAGAHRVYWVKTTPLLSFSYLVAPLANAADADAIEAQLEAGNWIGNVDRAKEVLAKRPADPKEIPEWEDAVRKFTVHSVVIRGMVVYGSQYVIDELTKNEHAAPSDLKEPLLSLSDTSFGLAATQTPLMAILLFLKDNDKFTEVAQRVKWISTGLRIDAKPTMMIMAKCNSAKDAGKANESLASAGTFARGTAPELAPILNLLKPKTEGDAIRLELSTSALEKLIPKIALDDDSPTTQPASTQPAATRPAGGNLRWAW